MKIQINMKNLLLLLATITALIGCVEKVEIPESEQVYSETVYTKHSKQYTRDRTLQTKVMSGDTLFELINEVECSGNCSIAELQYLRNEVLAIPENNFLNEPRRSRGDLIYPGEVITMPSGKEITYEGNEFVVYTPSTEESLSTAEQSDNQSENSFWSGLLTIFKWIGWIVIFLLGVAALLWIARALLGFDQDRPTERTTNVNFTLEGLEEDGWAPQDPSLIIDSIGKNHLNVEEVIYNGDSGSLTLKGVKSPKNSLFEDEDEDSEINIFVLGREDINEEE